MDIRLASILNLGIRKNENQISHYGFETALQIFILEKEDESLPSKGFFLAPVVGLTRNSIEEHFNIGFWGEPGYNLLIDEKYSLSFGLQLVVHISATTTTRMNGEIILG